MRVMRGKTFENKKGIWEKIEVELDSSDLLPDELAAPQFIQPVLLEIRAEKHLLAYMQRTGKFTDGELKGFLTELEDYRKQVMAIKPKQALRRKRVANES